MGVAHYLLGGPNWAPQDEGSVPGAIQCVNLHPQPISAAQLALHRSSYGIQGHRSGHSSTLPLPEDGYVQIPMAVKEAACAKLSIPWRPNLGIQRVSNAKGSLAYKCFWHPTATPCNSIGDHTDP